MKYSCYKKSILLLCMLACVGFVLFCLPASAYAETYTIWDYTHDISPDTFLIKYDVTKTYTDDSNLQINIEPPLFSSSSKSSSKKIPIGTITLKQKPKENNGGLLTAPSPSSDENKMPENWDILEDRSDEEAGLLLIGLPDGVELTRAIYNFGVDGEEDGIIYAKPNYLPINEDDPRYAPKILDSYRKDRLFVRYMDENGQHLPWEHVYEDGEYAVVKIPDGMTLIDAILYCSSQDYVFRTNPFPYYAKLAQKKVYLDISLDEIEIIYKKDSSTRLPWTLLNEEPSSDVYYYKIPAEMTMWDAIAYCGTIDDIIYVNPVGIPRLSSVDATAAKTPTPIKTETPQKTDATAVVTVSPTEQPPVLETPESTPTPAQSPLTTVGLIAGLLFSVTAYIRRN